MGFILGISKRPGKSLFACWLGFELGAWELGVFLLGKRREGVGKGGRFGSMVPISLLPFHYRPLHRRLSEFV